LGSACQPATAAPGYAARGIAEDGGMMFKPVQSMQATLQLSGGTKNRFQLRRSLPGSDFHSQPGLWLAF
jgi:hypothetical protein